MGRKKKIKKKSKKREKIVAKKFAGQNTFKPKANDEKISILFQQFQEIQKIQQFEGKFSTISTVFRWFFRGFRCVLNGFFR